jgi:hypothetical protein
MIVNSRFLSFDFGLMGINGWLSFRRHLDELPRTCKLVFKGKQNESFFWNILQMKAAHYKLIGLSGQLLSKFF